MRAVIKRGAGALCPADCIDSSRYACCLPGMSWHCCDNWVQGMVIDHRLAMRRSLVFSRISRAYTWSFYRDTLGTYFDTAIARLGETNGRHDSTEMWHSAHERIFSTRWLRWSWSKFCLSPACIVTKWKNVLLMKRQFIFFWPPPMVRGRSLLPSTILAKSYPLFKKCQHWSFCS